MPEYADRVPTILVLRRRLPLVVFVLLAVLLLMMVGIACACLGSHPTQAAADRVAGPLVALPPLTAMWALLVLVLAAVPLLFDRRIPATGRASPALLQRFLF